MRKNTTLGIIGSGATAIYLLNHILNHIDTLQEYIAEIAIFEKEGTIGMGMPYSPATTDIYNLANIASEELPQLPESFADWLRRQEEAVLRSFHIEQQEINESEVYSRIALGQYLHAQYQTIINRLKESGIRLYEFSRCEIVDIQDMPDQQRVKLMDDCGREFYFSNVVIATGHVWNESDRPEIGYYTSPWPIYKILPQEGEYHNFTIGTLGASLSAFDVVTSLAHRHGTFSREQGELVFRPDPKAEHFKVIMHSEQGWLPQLQYEQEFPIREIYRHVDKSGILALVDESGFLRIEQFFDTICRPALRLAFKKDEMEDVVEQLSQSSFQFKDFIKLMSDRHNYTDSFAGMRMELVEAKESVCKDKPVHWKEVFDDLMYCLNFHAELMPAEDHIFFHSTVMPFLMNVIAALPLSSAEILIALHKAGKIDIVAGRVHILDKQQAGVGTAIGFENGPHEGSTVMYKMFINCGGQNNITIEDYPFKSLVSNGTVTKARSVFADYQDWAEVDDDVDQNRITLQGKRMYWELGGIAVDASYRTVDTNGDVNNRLHDITFTHTSGLRPYSYGLQACSATSQILVETWVRAIKNKVEIEGDIQEVMKIYSDVEEL